MAIYTIGDLHLSLGDSSKSMEIFPGWNDYLNRLEESWRRQVGEEDTVVVAGDVSWAMRLRDTLPDFQFLDQLPGKKLLMKGNHDYWWTTKSKMDLFFEKEGLRSLSILHNNAVTVEGVSLCGSRGWLFEGSEKYDPIIVAREVGRIDRSLEAAPPGLEKLLFLHYPPIYGDQVIPEFFDSMKKYDVKECYYGHIHGGGAAGAFEGRYFGVDLKLISADFLKFCPYRVR